MPEPQAGSSVVVRSMTADSVVLSITTHDAASQTAQGQYISFSEAAACECGRGDPLRTVEQLDSIAEASGFRVDQRWKTRNVRTSTPTVHVTCRSIAQSQSRPSEESNVLS